MSECTWVALMRDKETNEFEQKHFRYFSFSDEENAKNFMQSNFNLTYEILEVSTNPYKYKKFLNGEDSLRGVFK